MNCLYNAMLALTLILLSTWSTSVAQSTGSPSSPATVLLTVTVTNNRKEVVSGLPKSAFTISDDKGTREITSFNSEDAPISIAMLFDISGSIRSPDGRNNTKFMAEALSHFVQRGHPANEYFIIGFNVKPYLLLDGTRDIDAVTSLLQRLPSVQLRGNTALYDACIFAVNRVTHGVFPKQIILLISDGQENVSQSTLDDLLRDLREKNVLVYALNTTMGLESKINPFNTEGSQVLHELTSMTGGVSHRPFSMAEMRADLERIAIELRHQYSISFSSAKEASGSKWHPLRIKVSSPPANRRDEQKLSGRSRKGYYSATGRE